MKMCDFWAWPVEAKAEIPKLESELIISVSLGSETEFGIFL